MKWFTDDDKAPCNSSEVGDVEAVAADSEKDYQVRPPVIAVMGHLGHGKTSLLDRIGSLQVAMREAGGNTQHLRASRIATENGPIVFLDTPGHEAFAAMRARIAESSDFILLVIAADDGFMPQTWECIEHSKAVSVPIVVAINKMDKKNARPEGVMADLATEGLVPEEWSGDVLVQQVSAYTGDGLGDLIDKVVLQAELLELIACPTLPGEGTVLETYFISNSGPVAEVLVRNGSLRSGEAVVAGTVWGEIKVLIEDGRPIEEAGPGTVVEVMGLSEMPTLGVPLHVATNMGKAREIAEQTKLQQLSTTDAGRVDLSVANRARTLEVIVKADTQGSLEALVPVLSGLTSEQVNVNIIHTGVGDVTASDVQFGTVSNCIVLGFNVQSEVTTANVDIRLSHVLPEAVSEIEAVIATLVPPQFVEEKLGTAEVRRTFTISKVGTIAGCMVTDGKIVRGARARVLRESITIWTGEFKSLCRFKDKMREITTGYECGISLGGFGSYKEKDVIECFDVVQLPGTLKVSVKPNPQEPADQPPAGQAPYPHADTATSSANPNAPPAAESSSASPPTAPAPTQTNAAGYAPPASSRSAT